MEKERKRREEAACSIRGKAQQQEEVRGMELVCPNWKKTQEYCGAKNIPEDIWLLELEWITGEVIATYIECRWYGKKGIYWEDNRRQEVLRRRRLGKAK